MYSLIMNRNPDIIYVTEYIKNVLYFAVVRNGKELHSTAETHYFSIDTQLVYENFYSDFGPLNLGCVYIYCTLLRDKLKDHLNKRVIVHYTSTDPRKKANAAFLLGCYGVLYLSLPPRDALKPLLAHNQTYRPFQDATQGDAVFTISILDCLQAIRKARDLSFFNFQDFNLDEYQQFDKIQGGDLNWIVPDKFLAFIGPVDHHVSMYHPPELYIDYFLSHNVRVVIRLNKRLYDANVFVKAGIMHYDLFFPDGSCPPRHILKKFLQIAEETTEAIAVHCKAGLGRTGTLIGSYLIKHFRMTAHEAIGWMRICRPGSVIGHQQAWLEQLEAWLIKQGNLYRKKLYGNMNKLPTIEYGVYSIAQKAKRQRPIILSKSPSPPPPMQRKTSNDQPSSRPRVAKTREENEDDTTKDTLTSQRQLMSVSEFETANREDSQKYKITRSQKIAHCCWMLAVRCAQIPPRKFHTICCICVCIDCVRNPLPMYPLAPEVVYGASARCDWRMKSSPSQKSGKVRVLSATTAPKPESSDRPRRLIGAAGEPRISRQHSRDSGPPINSNLYPLPSLQTNPMVRNIKETKIMWSKIYGMKNLNDTLTVTPHLSMEPTKPSYYVSPPMYSTNREPSPVSRNSSAQYRRRLGRSPSPLQTKVKMDNTKSTNTPSPKPIPIDKLLTAKQASKSMLKIDNSNLMSHMCGKGEESRKGHYMHNSQEPSFGPSSVGASSLGARRTAPAPLPAPSVRSDERPLATQGDLLNSIKFQRRFRETLHLEKNAAKIPLNSKCKASDYEPGNPKTSREKSMSPPRVPISTRPMSPKGKRTVHMSHYSSNYCT